VVEQYALSDEQLERAPAMRIGSRREAAAGGRPLEGGVGEGEFGDALRRMLESTVD
jgi:hypothetical protein